MKFCYAPITKYNGNDRSGTEAWKALTWIATDTRNVTDLVNHEVVECAAYNIQPLQGWDQHSFILSIYIQTLRVECILIQFLICDFVFEILLCSIANDNGNDRSGREAWKASTWIATDTRNVTGLVNHEVVECLNLLYSTPSGLGAAFAYFVYSYLNPLGLMHPDSILNCWICVWNFVMLNSQWQWKW